MPSSQNQRQAILAQQNDAQHGKVNPHPPRSPTSFQECGMKYQRVMPAPQFRKMAANITCWFRGINQRIKLS